LIQTPKTAAEKMMNYVLFNNYFPAIAERETRTLHVPSNSSSRLPAGDYTFLELFCNEKGCDCRRVFFYVISPLRKGAVAVIAYGWESTQFYVEWMKDDDPEIIRTLKGPVLNLTSPQSDLAGLILKLTEAVLLKDHAYIDRVKTHYRMFKDRIDSQQSETE
jgi:hypothetical protein